jgi:hypothetical protein
MALASAQVLDAQAALLSAAYPGKVFTSRLWPVTEADVPCWRAIATDEQVTVSMLPGTNEHLLGLSFVGYVRATADVDDAMHTLAAGGLTALFPAIPLYGLQLDAIERQLVSEGEASLGAITLRCTARFHVTPQTPEVIFT